MTQRAGARPAPAHAHLEESSTPTEVVDVPKDWNVVRFEEAVSIAEGQVGQVDPRQMRLLKCRTAHDLGLVSGKYLFRAGDVVYSKIRPYLQKSVLVDFSGLCSADMYPLTVRDGFDAQYIHFVTLSSPFTRQAISYQERTGIPKLNREQLSGILILKPPLPEQRVIGAILRKLQTALEVHERTLTRLGELEDATIGKLLREGVRGEPLTQTEIGEIPKSWDVVPLGAIADIGNGSTPKRDDPRYWQDGTIPWLSSARVHDLIIETPDQFVSATARTECHLPLVRKGGLVVAITGQGKTLGNVALLEFDTCVSQHLAYVQFSSDQIVPKFMLFYLQSRYRHLRQVSQSGGSTRGALTCGFLKTYKVPVPSSEEQRLITSAIEGVQQRVRSEDSRRHALRAVFVTTLQLLMAGQVRVAEGLIDRSLRAGPGRANAAKLFEGIVRRLVEGQAPERIFRYGAAVPGSPGAPEGAGLLVVMPFEGRSLAKAVELEGTVKPEVPVEILVRRPEEIENALRSGDPLIRGIIERGRLLHASANQTVRGSASPEPARRGTVSDEVLREITRRVVEVASPRTIVLFGSAARGEMGPDSDIDLLVVTETDQPRETAWQIRQRLIGIPPGIPKDVIVVTPEQLARHKDTIGFIYRPALREGRVLYAARP